MTPVLVVSCYVIRLLLLLMHSCGNHVFTVEVEVVQFYLHSTAGYREILR